MRAGDHNRSALWVDIFQLTILYKWIVYQFPIVHIHRYGGLQVSVLNEVTVSGDMVSKVVFDPAISVFLFFGGSSWKL
jgi:hypothetical protein